LVGGEEKKSLFGKAVTKNVNWLKCEGGENVRQGVALPPFLIGIEKHC
jgi:hypothetical protein